MHNPTTAAHKVNPFSHSLPIASRGQRLAADLIDACFLLLLLLIALLLAGETFLAAGWNGRWLSLLTAASYSALGAAGISEGQTLGRYLLGLRVVNRGGRSLGLGRAIVRSAALWGIFLLCNASYFGAQAEQVLNGVFIGALLGVAYGALLNSDTQQTFADILSGAYVVRLPLPAETYHAPARRNRQFGLMAVWLSLGLLLGLADAHLLRDPDLRALSEHLSADVRFLSVSATQADDDLLIRAWHREPCAPQVCIELVNALAEGTISAYPAAKEAERIEIVLFQRADVLFGFHLQLEPFLYRFLIGYEADPQSWLAELIPPLMEAGNVAYTAEDYAAAVAIYTRIIALEPRFANAYPNRGQSLSRMGQPQAALADLYAYQELMGEAASEDVLRLIGDLERDLGVGGDLPPQP